MRTGIERLPSGYQAACLVYFLFIAANCEAQELEPRAYSPNPVGVNFLVLAYAHTSGGVVFDQSLPFSDVNARLNLAATGYGHTFGLFNRAANAVISVPYVWGNIGGNVGEARAEVHRSGLADARFRIGVNLFGAPALTPFPCPRARGSR